MIHQEYKMDYKQHRYIAYVNFETSKILIEYYINFFVIITECSYIGAIELRC